MLADEKTKLDTLIDSGKPILVTEMAPPDGSDLEAVRSCARRYAGKVHAVGVSDNRDGVRMSALAAASAVAAEGIEPILHVVTRDRNRIALVSECLGAQALGVRNLLCTTGTHQTLGRCRGARNVFDIDSIQLLQMYADLTSSRAVLGGDGLQSAGSFCLGAVAAPYADPLEMQVARLAKKMAGGAKFLITQPVFDLERFETWWNEVTRMGIHEQVAILAGIQPLPDAESAKAWAETSPRPMIPDAVLERLASKGDESGQRAAGIEIACETIERLSNLEGLRGFEIRSDGDDDATERSSRGPGWGFDSRAGQVPHPYGARASPRPSRRQDGHRRLARGLRSCHNCVKDACVYGFYRDEADTLRDEIGYLDYIYQCKGCLSCVQDCTKGILTRVVNPEYQRLGDDYFTPDIILTTWFQAETGRIPVSGAGYGGPFSGAGFDSMWTDMSEIVRPTRDGIHGREYINTSVDIGRKLDHLAFEDGELASSPPPLIEMPLPVIFDVIPERWHRGSVVAAIVGPPRSWARCRSSGPIASRRNSASHGTGSFPG